MSKVDAFLPFPRLQTAERNNPGPPSWGQEGACSVLCQGWQRCVALSNEQLQAPAGEKKLVLCLRSTIRHQRAKESPLPHITILRQTQTRVHPRLSAWQSAGLLRVYPGVAQGLLCQGLAGLGWCETVSEPGNNVHDLLDTSLSSRNGWAISA